MLVLFGKVLLPVEALWRPPRVVCGACEMRQEESLVVAERLVDHVLDVRSDLRLGESRLLACVLGELGRGLTQNS